MAKRNGPVSCNFDAPEKQEVMDYIVLNTVISLGNSKVKVSYILNGQKARI